MYVHFHVRFHVRVHVRVHVRFHVRFHVRLHVRFHVRFYVRFYVSFNPLWYLAPVDEGALVEEVFEDEQHRVLVFAAGRHVGEDAGERTEAGRQLGSHVAG